MGIGNPSIKIKGIIKSKIIYEMKKSMFLLVLFATSTFALSSCGKSEKEQAQDYLTDHVLSGGSKPESVEVVKCEVEDFNAVSVYDTLCHVKELGCTRSKYSGAVLYIDYAITDSTKVVEYQYPSGHVYKFKAVVTTRSQFVVEKNVYVLDGKCYFEDELQNANKEIKHEAESVQQKFTPSNHISLPSYLAEGEWYSKKYLR